MPHNEQTDYLPSVPSLIRRQIQWLYLTSLDVTADLLVEVIRRAVCSLVYTTRTLVLSCAASTIHSPTSDEDVSYSFRTCRSCSNRYTPCFHYNGTTGRWRSSFQQVQQRKTVDKVQVVGIDPWVDRGTFWSGRNALCFVPPTFSGLEFCLQCTINRK